MKRLNEWFEHTVVTLPFWRAYVMMAVLCAALYCPFLLGVEYSGHLLFGSQVDPIAELLNAPVFGLAVALPLVAVTRGRARYAARARSVRISRQR